MLTNNDIQQWIEEYLTRDDGLSWEIMRTISLHLKSRDVELMTFEIKDALVDPEMVYALSSRDSYLHQGERDFECSIEACGNDKPVDINSKTDVLQFLINNIPVKAIRISRAQTKAEAELRELKRKEEEQKEAELRKQVQVQIKAFLGKSNIIQWTAELVRQFREEIPSTVWSTKSHFKFEVKKTISDQIKQSYR